LTGNKTVFIFKQIALVAYIIIWHYQYFLVVIMYIVCRRKKIYILCMLRASNRNFARRNKTASGPRGQTETSFKIENLRPNKTTGKLSEMACQTWKNRNLSYTWPMRGEFRRYIGLGPGEQEGSRESLKGHIVLAIDVLFRFWSPGTDWDFFQNWEFEAQ
jgi:hypothetical protein